MVPDTDTLPCPCPPPDPVALNSILGCACGPWAGTPITPIVVSASSERRSMMGTRKGTEPAYQGGGRKANGGISGNWDDEAVPAGCAGRRDLANRKRPVEDALTATRGRVPGPA